MSFESRSFLGAPDPHTHLPIYPASACLKSHLKFSMFPSELPHLSSAESSSRPAWCHQGPAARARNPSHLWRSCCTWWDCPRYAHRHHFGHQRSWGLLSNLFWGLLTFNLNLCSMGLHGQNLWKPQSDQSVPLQAHQWLSNPFGTEPQYSDVA